jgi:uncharacterized protein
MHRSGQKAVPQGIYGVYGKWNRKELEMIEVDVDNLEIMHNAKSNRFEVQLNGELAMAQYMRQGDTLRLTYTVVPPNYRGQGIAAKLAHAVLEYAKAEGLQVQPICSYMAAYVEGHPEYKSLTEGHG